MKPCHSCQTVIDESILDKQLEELHDLTVDEFNVCADCITIIADNGVECGGAVYGPRSDAVVPDHCSACGADRISQTGSDPGWTCDTLSN